MGRMKGDQTVGLLEFLKMEPQNYLIMNVHRSSRQGKNNPEGNSEIIRATPLVSKGEPTTSLSTGQTASAQSHGGWGCPASWGSHPALPKLQGKDCFPSGPTRWNFCPSVWKVGPLPPLDLEGRASSQRGLYLSLKSHGTCLVVWTYLGPLTPFFFPISPF